MPLTLGDIFRKMGQINNSGRPSRDPKFCSQYDDRKRAVLNAICVEKGWVPNDTDHMPLETEFKSPEVQSAFDELSAWFSNAPPEEIPALQRRVS